jgi:chromosome segregation ATPase
MATTTAHAQAAIDDLAAELHHADMLITEQAERIEALEAEVARLRAALAEASGVAA